MEQDGLDNERMVERLRADDSGGVLPSSLPAPTEVPLENVEVVSSEQLRIGKRSCRGVGKPSNAERSDIDLQKQDMRLMAGHILLHFKQAVIRKELDFSQELQLFKELSKYIGYATDGNKMAEDIGMDTFAMKYLEINSRIKSAAEKQSNKGRGKR